MTKATIYRTVVINSWKGNVYFKIPIYIVN